MAWDIGSGQQSGWDIGAAQKADVAAPATRNRAMVCSGWLLPFLPYFILLVS